MTTPEHPNDDDRRSQNKLILTLLQETRDSVKDLDSKLSTHMVEESKEWAESLTNLMKASFPAGDPEGHKRFHEASIQRAEKSAAFWEKMLYELAKWGLVLFIGWAAVALWQTFLQGPPK